MIKRISEITKMVEETHGAVRIKPREAKKGEPIEYEVRNFDGTEITETDEVVGKPVPKKLRGFIALDVTTARAMNVVRNALTPANRDRWDNIPLHKLVDFTWKNVK